MPTAPRYRRVMLKLSGEALMGQQNYGLEPKFVAEIAQDVADVRAMGVQVALATLAPVGTPVMLIPAGTRSLMVTLVAGPKAPAAFATVKA